MKRPAYPAASVMSIGAAAAVGRRSHSTAPVAATAYQAGSSALVGSLPAVSTGRVAKNEPCTTGRNSQKPASSRAAIRQATCRAATPARRFRALFTVQIRAKNIQGSYTSSNQEPMEAYVLLDYDNVVPLVRQALPAISARLHTALEQYAPNLDDVHIRLYGGWYDIAGLTSLGTVVTQEIAQHFPIAILATQGTNIVRRIFCELASSLIDSGPDILVWTFRRRRGIRSRLTSLRPQNCAAGGQCLIQSVVKWSRGKCPIPGCNVTAEDAFSYCEQKLVDTLLCCDLVALAGRTPPPSIFVLSEDDDMMPAFLMAGRAGARIWRCQTRPVTNPVYEVLLKRYNVQTIAI